MSALESLQAKGLPASFDLEQHGAKPMITISLLENVTVRLSYAFPGFSLADLTGTGAGEAPPPEAAAFRHEVGISGAGFLSESGKPLLPSFGRFLQIPPGYRVEWRETKTGRQTRQNINIRPSQENAQDQTAWSFDFDEKTYRRDEFYPKSNVEVSPPLYVDGYRVLCVHVRPMQYNPVQRILQCYSDIEVSFTFYPEAAPEGEGTGGAEVAPWNYRDRTRNLEGFGNFLFNPERKYFEKAGLPLPAREAAPAPAGVPEFMIIHDAALTAPAGKLRQWKRKCGLDTACVPITDILGADGMTRPRPEQVQTIKDYIRHRREATGSPLRYVLLLGDIDAIPTEERKRVGTPHPTLSDTTDYYFFTHRDARGTECLLPWIAGGRIAARTEAEGLGVVEQIIRYEKEPPDDPAYYRRMTAAAYFEDRDSDNRRDGRADRAYLKTMETIRKHMRSHGFDVQRVYVANHREAEFYSDGTPVPLEVREELFGDADGAMATKKLVGLINEGQLIIGHRGHGDRFGWLNPPLRIDDLGRIDSTAPSIFFSINCRTGCFDSGGTCFAEGLLAANGGAPSLIAATELSGAWRNDSMIKALFDAIWPGVIPTYPITTLRLPVKHFRLGDVLTYAKAYLLLAHGMNANTQKHLEIYHVVGDPTLPVWGAAPEQLRLQARVHQDILVVNMNSCPQEGVLSVWYHDVCLWKTKPSGPRLAIPLRLFDKLPDDAQSAQRDHTYRLSVCFAATGCRLAETHIWF